MFFRMDLSRRHIYLARIALVVTLGVVTWLATSHITAPAIANVNDKMAHLAAFYCLAILIDFAFPNEGFSLRKVVLLMSYGLLIELIQRQIPYREFSLLDWLADGVGVMLYPLSIPLLKNIPMLRLRWT